MAERTNYGFARGAGTLLYVPPVMMQPSSVRINSVLGDIRAACVGTYVLTPVNTSWNPRKSVRS